MNLFGKILTVIILVLSLIFSAVAVMVGATYKNWKQEAQKFETDLKAEQDLNVSLRATIQNLELEAQLEKVARARALAELQSRKITLEAQVKQKEEELALEKQKATEALAQEKEALARTAELDERIEELTKQNKEFAEAIAKTGKEYASLQNQNYGLQTEVNNKEERAKQLVGQLAKAARIMKVHNLDMDSETAHIEPVVDAEIKSVSGDLVVFSVGIDDGVRVGHAFDVYRKNKYVGQVVVTELYGGNRVSGKITQKVEEFRKEDSVVTRKQSTSTKSAGG